MPADTTVAKLSCMPFRSIARSAMIASSLPVWLAQVVRQVGVAAHCTPPSTS
jgi:hypothetical protein